MTIQFRDGIDVDGHQVALISPGTLPLPKGSVIRDQTSLETSWLVDCSACHRGYVSRWALAHGRLYLLEVVGKYEMRSAEPALAWWYSGDLTVGDGEVVERGYGDAPVHFEHERVLTIKYGIVRSIERVSHKPGECAAMAPMNRDQGRDILGNAVRWRWVAEDATPVNRAESAARLLRLYKCREQRPWNEWPPHPDQLSELLAELHSRARMA